jgi:hypothetical protein
MTIIVGTDIIIYLAMEIIHSTGEREKFRYQVDNEKRSSSSIDDERRNISSVPLRF